MASNVDLAAAIIVLLVDNDAYCGEVSSKGHSRLSYGNSSCACFAVPVERPSLAWQLPIAVDKSEVQRSNVQQRSLLGEAS